MPDPALALKDVTKTYGRRRALDTVTWRAEAGRVHGIVGANGSGKTTLLKVLAGLAVFDRGTAEVLGTPLSPGRHRIPGGVGIVLEGMLLLPQFTGRENLRLLASLRGRPDLERIDRLLVQFGLDPGDRRRVRAYSLGMRQRLNLAQAVMDHPHLLLLDEPTNGLDPGGASALLRMIAEPADRTVIMVSHRLDEVAAVCDQVWTMHEGRLTPAVAAAPSSGEWPS